MRVGSAEKHLLSTTHQLNRPDTVAGDFQARQGHGELAGCKMESLCAGSHREKLERAAQKLTEAARVFDYRLHFKIHEDTKRVIVQVIDEKSGEILNEAPPEKILNLLAEIWRLVGLLVDKRA